MKRFFPFFLLMLISPIWADNFDSRVEQLTLPATPRFSHLINSNWRFIKGDVPGAEAVVFDDSTWNDVNIPHSASIPYWMETSVYEGLTWYRKSFTLDANFKSRRVLVEFEGAFQHAWVYLNGKLLGEHKGGYTGFEYDMTPYLNFGGENVLAVKLKNGWEATLAPRAGDSIFPNGLNRYVRIVAVSPCHIDWCGQFITTPKVSEQQSSVHITTDVRNDDSSDKSCLVNIDIVDAEGSVVTSSTQSTTVPAGAVRSVSQDFPEITTPHLWSPDNPYLYHVRTRVMEGANVTDTDEETLGIRWFEFTADKGFFLNGKHLYLWGFDAHEDRAGWANAVTDADMERDMKMLKAAGANCIRACHNPHPRAFYQACDRLGLLVWDELHLWGRGGFKGGDDGSYMASAYPVAAADVPEFEQNLKDNFHDMILEHRNHPCVIAWSLGNETDMQMGEPVRSQCVAFVRVLNDEAHALDPTRPTGVGGTFTRDAIADVTGYNGGGPKEKPKQNTAVLTTEWNGNTPTSEPWRSGALRWVAFDYGTHCADGSGRTYGHQGVCDYFRLPHPAYYQMRQQATGEAQPAPLPKGTPASLSLSADKLQLFNDGTDDSQLVIGVVDAQGKPISNEVPVTLTIVNGPGQLPTGRSWGCKTSNQGRQAIEFRCYQPGTTRIQASSPNLTAASIEIETVSR